MKNVLINLNRIKFGERSPKINNKNNPFRLETHISIAIIINNHSNGISGDNSFKKCKISAQKSITENLLMKIEIPSVEPS